MKTKTKQTEDKAELDRNYFSTPSTSLDTQRQVTDFDSFDESSESYRKSHTQIIFKKYIIR